MSLLKSHSNMRLLAVLTCALLFSIAATEPSESQRAGLNGAWSGVGTINLPSGDAERVRCRVRFSSGGDGLYNMNAVCASPSARAVQTAVIERVGSNSYAGSFHNAEYNYSGSIFITVKGNRLNASLSGGGASGHISLRRS